MEDIHGLNLSLTLKYPPSVHPLHHPNHHTVKPILPQPSGLLSSLGPCPYKLIPSPYNFHPHNHQILALPNYKLPSYADTDKEKKANNEEKRRQAAAMVVKKRKRPEMEEEVVISFANSSTLSRAVVAANLSKNKRSVEREDYRVDRDFSPSYIEVNEDEDGGDAAARKKAAVFEETFKEQHTLSMGQKVASAKQLDLQPRQVKVWFQNRRTRTKLKQTEMNCRHLRRYCQTLSDENKRLQKEMTELRAFKRSPVSYMNMSPPTTLSMCPQCVGVTTFSSSSTQPSCVAGTVNTNHPKTVSLFPLAKLNSSEALDIRSP